MIYFTPAERRAFLVAARQIAAAWPDCPYAVTVADPVQTPCTDAEAIINHLGDVLNVTTGDTLELRHDNEAAFERWRRCFLMSLAASVLTRYRSCEDENTITVTAPGDIKLVCRNPYTTWAQWFAGHADDPKPYRGMAVAHITTWRLAGPMTPQRFGTFNREGVRA